MKVESLDIEDCHRIGKPDKADSKETIIRFANRKYGKKALLSRKKKKKKNWANALSLTLTLKYLSMKT